MRKKTVSVGLELLFTLLMAGVLSSRAATFTWVNPNSGDWSNPANWSSSGGPASLARKTPPSSPMRM